MNPETTTPPTSLQEAIIYFADKNRAHDLMVSLRWPEGVACPHCQSADVSFLAKWFRFQCRGCRKQFTVKTGSVMEDSPLGLDKWLSAMWLIGNAKNGISSCEIHRALKITQKSAWFLLHRIRLAMQTGTFEKLSGTVEADETFIGGKARNMHAKERARRITGTGGADKTPVLGIVQRGTEDQPSQVQTAVVADRRKKTLQAEVKNRVEKGAELFTDALKSYEGLDEEYQHAVVDHAEYYVEGKVHTNSAENFWSLLKRALGGTYVSVEPFHLFRYLDEQAFRFNQRKDDDQGRFLSVAGQVAGKRLTYAELTGKLLEPGS
jgi:transposase-like protein